MKKIALLITAVVAFGCTDAQQSKIGGLGPSVSTIPIDIIYCLFNCLSLF